MAGLFLIILYPSSPLWAQDAIAFFYGNPDHVEALSLYDRVVIQPDQTTPETIQRLKTLGTTVYGYLSISELPQDALDATLQKALIGENKNWNAHIFDITHPTWQQHLLQTAKHYRDMGFDGVFLDTLDSYRLTSLSNTAQHAQAQGLVDIIQRLSAIFSGQVLINRGFDILESVSRYIQAVVTESVFYAYTPGPSPDPFQQHDAPLHVSTTKHITTANYFPTSPDERRWALNDLAKAKALNLEVIVIDYLEHHSQRYAHAAELIRLGFTPYVTNGLLNEYGVSTKTLIRNRVLALYDSTQNPLVESHVFTNLTLPFERAGYPMDFFDVRTNALPRPDTSRYAGVIIWLPNHSTLTQSPEFAEWIAAWHKASAILWINTPASRAIQNRLGFHFTPLPSTSNHSAWQFNDPRHLAGFENTLSSAGPVLNQTLHLRDPHRVLFSLTTPTGTAPLAAQMPWGVVAVSNSLFMTDPFKDVRWILNPATLIHDFLGLPALPTADATTESGRRIATAHIDGDGFPSRATLDKHPYTAEVILNEILTSYPDIPTTVSIIEGEISEQGLHPQTSSELEAIARRLFALPHVEIASHSFSHPFFWSRDPESVYAPLGQHLPLEDYDLDFTREIYGSIDYINRRLAPKNKKTAV
ncbi:MAG: endo alpha-1,4 polygalactosaminidase, partial [Gammaproteobacteria bacterium]